MGPGCHEGRSCAVCYGAWPDVWPYVPAHLGASGAGDLASHAACGRALPERPAPDGTPEGFLTLL